MSGPLALGWLVVAHLVADFVLQPDRMAAAKFDASGRALRAFLAHDLVVAACLLPFVLAFGAAGLWTLVAVAALHFAIDAAKARLTRRVEHDAMRLAREVGEPIARPATLGTAWTPLPAALFLADQAAHALVLATAWWLWLHDAPLTATFANLTETLTRGMAASDVHALAAAAVVGAGLVIVNVRAGSLFVGLLLRPAPAISGAPQLATPAPVPSGSDRAASAPRAYTLRLGPLTAHVRPEDPVPAEPRTVERLASPGRVGSAIGIVERLLVVMLVLAGAQLAIGLVVAAKTLARFKQLDDREFAEYYLLGTLASIAIAVGSALAGAAALAVL